MPNNMTGNRLWVIAKLLSFCAGFAALSEVDAFGGELSRGRQIILDRGLQIQAMTLPLQGTGPEIPEVYRGQGLTNLNKWCQANFTTINVWWSSAEYNLPLLAQMPAGVQWGRDYEGAWELLPAASERPYVNRLASFQYYDEHDQTQPEQDDEKAAYASLRAACPNTLIYTNSAVVAGHGPTTVAALKQYMQYTRPDMLSFDWYPSAYDGNFSFSTPSRNTWYSNMQMYRTAGLAGYDDTGASPIPYAQFLDLYRPSYTAATPSESFVRLQHNASWAFGYSMVNAYVYNDWDVGVMFDSKGETAPNAVFNYVAETNRQSRNLGPALTRLVSTDIRMIPGTYRHQDWFLGSYHNHDLPLPDGISPWAAGHLHGDINGNNGGNDYITGITPISGLGGSAVDVHGDVLIGYFKPLLAGNNSFLNGTNFMIVNGASQGTAAASAQWYHLTFDFTGSTFNELLRLSRDTGKLEAIPLTHLSGAQYYLDLDLPGGTGDLFGYWNSGTPLPSVPEPGTLMLSLIGLIGMMALAQRKRRNVDRA